MKVKNLFFAVCASMVVASEISAMQLVTKRVPKSMHRVNTMGPMLQKRSMNGSDVIESLMLLPGICVFVGIPLLASCAIVGAVGYVTVGVVSVPFLIAADVIKYQMNRKAAYKNVAQFDECIKAYKTKSLCCDCICSKDGNNIKFLENIDKKWLNRLGCLQQLQTRYNQCCLVEDRKSDQFWLESKNQNIDIAKYRDEFGAIDHKKACLYNAVILIKEDMPHFQKKAEKMYAERLQLMSVSDEVTKCVKQQEKIDQMYHIIEDISRKHTHLQNKAIKFKLLTDLSKHEQSNVKEQIRE